MENRFLKKSLQFTVATLACASLPVMAGGHHHASSHKYKAKHSKKHASRKSSGKVRVVRRDGKLYVVGLTPEQARRFKASLAQQQTITTAFGSPVVSIGAPNAFGGTGTSVFLSGTYVNHWPTTTEEDGLMNFGVSFGDPHKYIGVLVSAAFTSLGINNQSFGSNGFVGMRLNRYLTPTTAVAFGVSVLDGWGTASNIANSFYGALTHSFHVWLPMAINVGFGTGSFNKAVDVTANKDDDVNGFVGYGVTIFKGMSLIVDYASEEVNFGGTYACSFHRKIPFFISLAGKNLNENDNGKAYFQATAGISYLFS